MKKKRIYQIDRRNFLKGLGSSVVALPMFDFFLNNNGTAYAQGAEFAKRYFLILNGVSSSRGSSGNLLYPQGTGTNYTNIKALEPLNNFPELRPYLGLYSGLYLPFTPMTSSQPVPVAGYKGNFHNVAGEVQLTGSRKDQDRSDIKITASSDQILRMQLNSNGQFKHINASVQPKNYLGGNGGNRRFAQFNSSGGGIDPQKSPRGLFDELFFNFQEGDPAAEAERKLAAEKRKSVLDLLAEERVAFLKRELSPRELSQLSDHFDKIRDLEKSLETVEDDIVTATCKKPARPTDPAVGADHIGAASANEDPNLGYSNEDLRADLMIDLITMALTCDIARHGTLRLTLNQSYMNMYRIAGIVAVYHEMSHGQGSTSNFIKAIGWHVEKYAKFLDKLRTTPEGSGNVLDNSAILFVTEGGNGPNSDDTSKGMSAHSGHNMFTMVAGKAGGLRPGRHVALNEVHPSRILLSAMMAVGYTGNTLGEVSGRVNDMF